MIWFLVWLQAAGWRVHPDRPTVGDTIWVEAGIEVPAGWAVRPAVIQPGEGIEVLHAGATPVLDSGYVTVRYALVAWHVGTHSLAVPGALRLGPDGQVDSLPGVILELAVATVLTSDTAPPRPPRGGVGRRVRGAWVLVLAVLLAFGGQAILIAGRRRGPRLPAPAGARDDATDETADGPLEPRLLATRASAQLRGAIARWEPDAHRGLTTEECLAALTRLHPEWPPPQRERLAQTLRRLDEARFASLPDANVEVLVAEAVEQRRNIERASRA